MMLSFKAWLESSISRLKLSGGLRVYILVAVLILGGGMLLSYLIAMNQHRHNEQRAEDALTGGSAYLNQSLTQRLQSYEEILRSGASLARISDGITKQQWHDFIKDLDVRNRYPGTRAFAYATYVPQAKLSTHIKNVRAQGDSDYAVFPPGKRDLYVPVTYAELAESSESAQTLGFDIFSEPNRRAALISARDTGKVSVTDPIVLRGDIEEAVKPIAVTIYFPVYSGVNNPTTQTERRTDITGFTFVALRVNELIVGLFGQEALSNPNSGLMLTALNSQNERVELYTSPSFLRLVAQSGVHKKTIPLTIHGKTWEATIVVAAGGGNVWVQNPWVLFAVGSFVSLLLAALLFMLMINRLIRTMVSQEINIQQAKDDLLSLTSHQLRTPASGVKQYLGLVLQGYSGKISKKQKEVLKKAYSANERQLEIINQLLYVAKADAGQIRLEKKHHNLTMLLRDVVDNYQDEAASRRISLNFRRTTPVELKADPRFVRMIIENLLSNAIKYSYPGSSVSLTLNTQGNRVVLRVKDKGVGIAREEHPKLFQKFSRIDNELSREAGGSGIGLYLAQKLAEAHGGSIKVVSEAGTGATFTLRLPGLVQRRAHSSKT